MGLLYSGLDEAGYGPMLGPLCVGRASIRVEDWSPIGEDGESRRVPDLWSLLSASVAKTRKEAKGRIAVADSKKLKLASSSVRNHPLVHLERGVLAMLGTVGDVPRTDAELFEIGMLPSCINWAVKWHSQDVVDVDRYVRLLLDLCHGLPIKKLEAGEM